jgi:hypothetical protein
MTSSARDVAGTFSGRAQAARLALIDGAAGLVWATRGKPRVVFRLTISGGKITAIDMTAGPGRLRQIDLKIIDDSDEGLADHSAGRTAVCACAAAGSAAMGAAAPRACGGYSGPRRSSVPHTTAPTAKMAAVHQNPAI